MPQPFRLTLEAELHTALHTQGPGRTLPLVDRAIEVDAQGYPYVPASSLRGRLRSGLERLLRAWDQPVCTPPRPDGMCPHNAEVAQHIDQLTDGYCLACRLFGSPWREAAVICHDLTLNADDRTRLSLEPVLRPSVSISRRLATAQSERLFVMQTTPPLSEDEALHFTSVIEGFAERDEVGWLVVALAMVTHMGGAKARGLGRLTLAAGDLVWRTNGGERVETAAVLAEEVLADVSH